VAARLPFASRARCALEQAKWREGSVEPRANLPADGLPEFVMIFRISPGACRLKTAARCAVSVCGSGGWIEERTIGGRMWANSQHATCPRYCVGICRALARISPFRATSLNPKVLRMVGLQRALAQRAPLRRVPRRPRQALCSHHL